MKRIKIKIGDTKTKDIYIEDELIDNLKEFGGLFLLASAIIIAFVSAATFMFFYLSPWMIVWSILLILLRVRICDASIEISLEKFLQKYLRVNITIT